MTAVKEFVIKFVQSQIRNGEFIRPRNHFFMYSKWGCKDFIVNIFDAANNLVFYGRIPYEHLLNVANELEIAYEDYFKDINDAVKLNDCRLFEYILKENELIFRIMKNENNLSIIYLEIDLEIKSDPEVVRKTTLDIIDFYQKTVTYQNAEILKLKKEHFELNTVYERSIIEKLQWKKSVLTRFAHIIFDKRRLIHQLRAQIDKFKTDREATANNLS